MEWNLVGERENVFHHVPTIIVVNDAEELIGLLVEKLIPLTPGQGRRLTLGEMAIEMIKKVGRNDDILRLLHEIEKWEEGK
jgi:hypothetical protein